VNETAREWISFEDPTEERTWVFDVTFLLSRWTCIFGQGCQGVLTGPASDLVQGCCSYGAHFTDAADEARVEAAAKTLTAKQWQFRKEGRAKGVVTTNDDGERVTPMVEDACVFLNRPGFAGGPGCALHRAALDRGERPMDLKPDVCWQLPLRREERDDGGGHITSTIVEWKRVDWGEGGDEFHWWCTEAPEAFAGAAPVYRAMADELTGLVGDEVYERLAGYLDERSGGSVPLPHPTVRVTTGA
jgi:hypothetical protein